jgi:PHP family Zn ribbon phosphoesterase
MDDRDREKINPIIQLPNYGEEEYSAFCKFCLQYWIRRAPKTLTRCPNCGEPCYEKL